MTKKNNASHFGNNLHTVQRTAILLIREFVVTTAPLHDTQADLSVPGIVNYKDKSYFGVDGRGIDAAMDRAVRGQKLPIKSISRNLRITRKRSRGERPYSVMKSILNGGHVFDTTVPGVQSVLYH